LGTGNQTANVSCAILERLFDDPNMKLWDYDSETLLPNLPTMVTFPNLHNFYEDWRKDLESKGVDIRLQTEVKEVVSRSEKGIVIRTQPCKDINSEVEALGPGSEDYTNGPRTDTFDELILCVLADDALKILGKTTCWRERYVLNGAKFFDDITVTHSDSAYFQKHYETKFDPGLCAEPKSKEQAVQIAFSKGEARGPDDEPGPFRPMYYTKSYKEDPQKIEMSFDCTNYQHQFRMDHDAEIAPVEYESHVFQSIFLDNNNKDMWTIDEIDESKIIERKWWHQLGHRWQHYVRVVPCMMFLNGRNHTVSSSSTVILAFSQLVSILCLHYPLL
jgi:hypothetical protein